MQKPKITTAVILAGGRGVRLRPLTDTVPKPMVEVCGKPFLLYQISLLKRGGISEFIICAGYLKEKIMDYFGDGAPMSVKIAYSIENDFLGTGGALKNAQEMLPERFLVINGDTYLPMDYVGLIKFCSGFNTNALSKSSLRGSPDELCRDDRSNPKNVIASSQEPLLAMTHGASSSARNDTNCVGVVVCYNNPDKIAPNNIYLDAAGIILKYAKTGADSRLNCVDAGVSVFKKEVLGHIPARRPFSLEKELFPCLIKNKQLIGYPVAGRFYDIGTPDGLKQIEEALE